MAEDTSGAAKNELAQRFANEDTDDAPPNTESDETEGDEGPTNIKEEWTNHSVYLSDDLTADLRKSYKFLDADIDAGYGVSLAKTRDYYPLVIALGLERLDEMDVGEVKERLEDLER